MNEQAKLLAREGNLAVVHLPGRHFPGLMMQGDTFHNLLEQVRMVRDAKDPEERQDELEYAIKEMEEALEFYAKTLRAMNLQLPYTTKSD